MTQITRRRLLLQAALAAAAGPLARVRAPSRQESLGTLEERVLGRTGRKLPCLGLGCYPLGNLAREDDALAIVERAYSSGARYFDTAPSYGDGRSERIVGRALASRPRSSFFLATKTLARDGESALEELGESLARLGLDYVDSVQIHAVASRSDLDRALAVDGAVRALEDAKKRGLVRHIGITGHANPSHLREGIERYAFDTALVPVNPLDCHHLSFVREFLPLAREKGVAVIAMKIYAGGALPRARDISASDLVRFALAQKGVAVAVPGADSIERWDEARAAAVMPAPTAAEMEELIRRAGPHKGRASEWYKDA